MRKPPAVNLSAPDGQQVIRPPTTCRPPAVEGTSAGRKSVFPSTLLTHIYIIREKNPVLLTYLHTPFCIISVSSRVLKKAVVSLLEKNSLLCQPNPLNADKVFFQLTEVNNFPTLLVRMCPAPYFRSRKTERKQRKHPFPSCPIRNRSPCVLYDACIYNKVCRHRPH